MSKLSLSRRSFVAGAAVAGAAAGSRPTICAFSKHFQWTDVRETAGLCAQLGYEGIDLTVRNGGHVLPERVEEDLPKAAEMIRGAGLELPMVTSGIVDAASPHAEKILKTLAMLKITRYRWDGFHYRDMPSIPEQLMGFTARVKDLAAMNRHYGVCAMYHTHSGVGYVGASQWDLYLLLKDFDASAVAVNYDIGHATVEGGAGGWVASSRLLMPRIRGAAVKDFRWKQNAKGKWVPGWCALGQGMVDFAAFLAMLKAARFAGPLQLHMEYPELGGADSGKKQISISKDALLAIMRRDLDTLKQMLREAGM